MRRGSGANAVSGLAAGHITDFALYSAVVLVVFVAARLANAGPALALTLSIVPVVVAWMFTNPTAHAAMVGVLGIR